MQGLTISEPRPDHGAVRESPVENRATRSLNCIRQPNHIAHGRSGADVLQSGCVWTLQALLAELSVLRIDDRGLGIQICEVGLVGKVSQPVDARHLNRAVPEGAELIVRQAVHITRAGTAETTSATANGQEMAETGNPLGVRTDTTRVPADEVVSTTGTIHESLCVSHKGLQPRNSRAT